MVLTGERMFIYFATALIVCLMTLVKGQYYGNQPPPQPQPPSPQYSQQQQNSQQHNSEAWRRWYYQQRQRQQQHSAYSSSRGQQSAPMASPAANSQNPSYYNQRQPQPQYSQQQYYQQRQPGSYGQPQGYGPPPPQGYGPPQSYNYGNYQPAPVTPPPLTTPAVPLEVEFELEVPTTTTTPRPQSGYNQWGGYNQNYAPAGQYGGQYQQQPPYQQGQYQQPAAQPQPSGFSNYYPPPQSQQQQPPQPSAPTQQPQQPSQPQQPPPQHPPQQQQYSQSSWNQPTSQQGGSYGGQPQPTPADVTDPFSTRFETIGLKPTVFNSEYQNQAQQTNNELAGLFGDQGTNRQNPNAPPGKTDFSAKGPNPIQLNQFLAQPTSPKESNALDALLGTLLSGTVAVQSNQKGATKPVRTTTKVPTVVPESSRISDRLSGFVLGPKSEFRNNMFNDIPVNNAGFDRLNPLAGFMGETPPPPTTTTPPPPGRNGDFLEGFIGVNRPIQQSRPPRDSFQPNIYVYNPVNDSPPQTTAAPRPSPAMIDQSLSNIGTQDLSHLVQKLLGVLAEKQVSGQAQGTVSGQV